MNAQRFFNTLKVVFASERRMMTRKMLGFALCLSAVFALSVMALPENPEEYRVVNAMETCRNVTLSAMFFLMLVCGSFICNDLESKQKRTAFFSLPSSMTEKYIVRLLWCMVGFLLIFCGAVLLAELVRMAICMIKFGQVYGSLFTALSVTTSDSVIKITVKGFDAPLLPEDKAIFRLFLVSVYLFYQSCYVLGGFFFRKQPWILTTFVLGCLTWLLIVTDVFEYIGSAMSTILDDNVSPYIFIVVGFLLLLTVANYYLSYRIFCRFQVIGNRFFNL